jgi:hypothetical protein
MLTTSSQTLHTLYTPYPPEGSQISFQKLKVGVNRRSDVSIEHVEESDGAIHRDGGAVQCPGWGAEMEYRW